MLPRNVLVVKRTAGSTPVPALFAPVAGRESEAHGGAKRSRGTRCRPHTPSLPFCSRPRRGRAACRAFARKRDDRAANRQRHHRSPAHHLRRVAGHRGGAPHVAPSRESATMARQTAGGITGHRRTDWGESQAREGAARHVAPSRESATMMCGGPRGASAVIGATAKRTREGRPPPEVPHGTSERADLNNTARPAPRNTHVDSSG